MGLNPGKGTRRLPDLGMYPSSECREPSYGVPTEPFERPFPLSSGHRAGLKTVYRKGTTEALAFAVYQSIYVEDAWWEVFRIDSWHGTVHRHNFTKAGGNNVTILVNLPEGNVEKVIDLWCRRAEDVIMTEWEANVGRWQGD